LRHGGYRALKSFQVAQLVYDVTVAFCERYVDRRSRTHDQMVQAARSGVQNIAVGSMASATSRKTEMKLTGVARASLEELRLDYEDFLRQRGRLVWPREHPALADLRRRRPTTLDAFRVWVNTGAERGRPGPPGRAGPRESRLSSPSSVSSSSSFPTAPAAIRSAACAGSERVAQGALLLIGVASYCLARQLAALGQEFEREGGFSERLCRLRAGRR
jgi:four helix bundle suffix protein